MISARLAPLSSVLATPALAEKTQAPYPFERFEGSWTLKNDRFEQVLDGETLKTLSIPGYRTGCARVNTDMSVLCKVDAVDFKGQIFWVVDPETGTVFHLAQLGISRIVRGAGDLHANGNVALWVTVIDEPFGTYRRYSYKWLSDDAYEMKSIQYDNDGQPTGNWYGGTFVRIEDRTE